MLTLRHPLSWCRSGREQIPLDQSHLLEVIGENASGKKAGYTPTSDNPATIAWRNG